MPPIVVEGNAVAGLFGELASVLMGNGLAYCWLVCTHFMRFDGGPATNPKAK